MKVLFVNGSSHIEGTTIQAINEMIKIFDEEKIETEVIQLGKNPIADCLQCEACSKTGKCIIDDGVNEFLDKAVEADGFVFATPVYYAHPSGRILSFLNRVFYSNGEARNAFRFKVGAAVAVCRRGGASASLDVINKYFGISQMPIAGSTYWNMTHGLVAKDAQEDKEGMQTMRNLARNMTWMMRCFDEGKKNGVPYPAIELDAVTNFVR